MLLIQQKFCRDSPLYKIHGRLNFMWKLLPFLIAFIFPLVFTTFVWAGDFYKGLLAAEKGDFLTALMEWEPLALAGDDMAQFNLGQLYNKGGVDLPKSHETAAKWFSLAADSGHAGAQYNLGWMYDNGYGVQKNFKVAVKWFILAAEQEDPDAQFNLAHHYALGNGVKVDYVYAYMWASFSDSNGSKDGKKLRGYLEKLLNPSQKRESQKLSKECIRKKYQGC